LKAMAWLLLLFLNFNVLIKAKHFIVKTKHGRFLAQTKGQLEHVQNEDVDRRMKNTKSQSTFSDYSEDLNISKLGMREECTSNKQCQWPAICSYVKKNKRLCIGPGTKKEGELCEKLYQCDYKHLSCWGVSQPVKINGRLQYECVKKKSLGEGERCLGIGPQSCREDLVCANANFSRKASVSVSVCRRKGGAGHPCFKTYQCKENHICDEKSNKCVKVEAPGKEGDYCSASIPCAKHLICGEFCIRPGTIKKGEKCYFHLIYHYYRYNQTVNNECEKGLTCKLKEWTSGFSSTCEEIDAKY